MSFALIIAAGVSAIAGGLLTGKKTKVILFASGLFSLLSVLVFGAGIQSELAATSPIVGFPVNLFPSIQTADITDTIYFLDYGFWIALIAGILAFISAFWNRISKTFQQTKS